MQRWKFALAMLVLAAACKKEQHKLAPVDVEKSAEPSVEEVEPNNDSKSAQVLKGSAAVHASFAEGPKVDDDWYRLEAPNPLIARIEANSVTALDLELTVYDADKNKLLHLSGSQSVTVPNITCTTACYIHLAPGKKGASGNYTLTVTATPPGARDEHEPNNRYVDAQEIRLNSAIDGYLSPADDQDWYKLVPAGLTSDQVISVTVTPPADVWPELTVARMSDQSPLATYRAAELGAEIKVRDLAAPAPPETGYYLQLRSAWAGHNKRTSNAKAAYTIEVKAAPGAPNLEQEPNNDAAHATPIDLTSLKRTGFISPKGDVDWYTFTTTQPSIVHADVTGLDKVKLVLAIIDPTKKDEEKHNELAKCDSGDIKEPQALSGIAVPAGQNYIRVEGAYKQIDGKWVHDYENVNDTYTLTLTVDPDDGTYEREPNDQPDKATPVEVGKQYKGYIQPAKDVDYYKLEVKEASSVAISVSAVPKLDLGIKVLDAKRKDEKGEYALIGSIDKNRIEAEERLVVPFEPGTYYIEITEKGRESNSQKPYILSLK